MASTETAAVVTRPTRTGESGFLVRAALVWVASYAKRPWAIPVLLAVVTAIAFLPMLKNQWVDWDDQVILLNNTNYRGLGWPQLRWMFSNILMGHYVPVTWLTYGLDYTLWGMKPIGYHLTSLLLHAANAALAYGIALQLLRKATALEAVALRVAAAFAALFFALHPLRVESVAWATERRDVLSGLFFLASVLTYLCASERGTTARRWLLGASLGSFVLAIFSKSIVMTLPLVLILLDIFPLGRLGTNPRRWLEAPFRRVWLEKLPYAILGLVAAGLGYYAQAANSYFTSLASYPPSARIGMGFYSVWFYLSKTALPIGLSPLYELPARVEPLALRFLLPMIGVLVTTGLVIVLRRRWPAGLAAWAYYVVVLAPVTGLTHSGYQLAHDRYSYLSCLAFGLLAGGAVGLVVRAHRGGTLRPAVASVAVVGTVVWLLGLASLSWQQVQIWHDSESLWRYAVEFEPECSICHANLGTFFYNNHLPGLAVEEFERVIRLRPDRVKTHHSLGLALAALGRTPEAIDHFQSVLRVHPNETDVLNNLGVAFISQREFDKALTYLERAKSLNPRHPQVLTNIGVALTELGRAEDAVLTLRRAIEVAPKEPLPRVALARAYLTLGNQAGAHEQYEVLRELDARLASALGASLFGEW